MLLEQLIKDKEAKQKDRVAALELLQNLGEEAIPSLKSLINCPNLEETVKEKAKQILAMLQERPQPQAKSVA